MNKNFLKENRRKTALFEKWIEFLTAYHQSVGDIEYDEIIEGTANVCKQKRDSVDLKLDNGRTIADLRISDDLSNMICLTDQIYVVVGLKNRKWHFLDVVSIGSIISEKLGEFHITFNPIYLGDGLEGSQRN